MLVERLRKKPKVVRHDRFEGVATIEVEEVRYEFLEKAPSRVVKFRVREKDESDVVRRIYDFAIGQVLRWDPVSVQRSQSIDEILIKESQGHEIYVDGEYIRRRRRTKVLGWAGSQEHEVIYQGTIAVNNDKYFFMINTKGNPREDILARIR